MKLTNGAAAPNADAGLSTFPLHIRALLGRQRRLDAVRMRRAELDGRDLGGAASLQQCRQIPFRREVVRDKAELEFERLTRRAGVGPRSTCRARDCRRGAEELTSWNRSHGSQLR